MIEKEWYFFLGEPMYSLQAIYVPADDLTDPAPATTFAHLDATTVLSRGIAELGIYPAVDPLDSTSRILDPNIVGEEHYSVARSIQKTLQVKPNKKQSFSNEFLSDHFRITNPYKISLLFWVWMNYLMTIN